MAPTTTLTDVFWGLLDPWGFMFVALTFLPRTVAQRLTRTTGARRSSPSSSPPPSLRDEWFARFWAWAGPQLRTAQRGRVVALLQGRVRRGREVERAAHAAAAGTVLEVGPGSGLWVGLLAGTAATRVVGVEPNRALHGALAAEVRKHGLEAVYEIAPVGIQDLAASGVVAEGEVDCIVSVLCLCSIPDPEANIRQLYRYLKPGGRWYIYEHVKCEHSRPMIWYQALINLFWPRIIGGCNIQRETGKWLRQCGSWSEFDVAQPPEEPWFHSLPHILGVATK